MRKNLLFILYLKNLLFFFYQIKNLTQHLFCDWKTLKTIEEYEIMKSYAKNSRRFSLIYSGEDKISNLLCIIYLNQKFVLSTISLFLNRASYIAVYNSIAVIVFMSMSLVPYILDIVLPLNESRPVLPPYRGYYFVDIRDYFFQILWHAIVAWEIVVAGVIAHDCMFVTYVEHVCSMFAITGLENNIFTI